MKSCWAIKKLGEVCEILYGFPFESKLFNSDGKGKQVVRIRDVLRGYSETYTTEKCESKYMLSRGDVLIGMDGDFHVAEWKVDGALLNQRVCKIDSGCQITNKYLLYVLPIELKKIWDFKLFSTVKHLSAKDLNGIDVALPPLPDQKRIVAKIDAAFEKIDKLKANAERNLANAKGLFQSALDEAMRPRKGWVEKRLGEVCDGKLSYGTSAPSCQYNGKVRYIRITDIDGEGRLLDELVSPQTFELKHVLVEGDIVLARTGATVGKSYLYSPSDGDCVYAGYLIRARVNRSLVLPEFAYYFTKTGSYWRYIQAEKSSATQPNVNAEKYGKLLIPVPPLKEQRETVTMARVIHEKSLKLQQHYTRLIADCAEMRQSVLREAFEGRL